MADAPEVVPSTHPIDTKGSHGAQDVHDAYPTYSSADTGVSTLIGSTQVPRSQSDDGGLQKSGYASPRRPAPHDLFSSESLIPVTTPQEITPAPEFPSSRELGDAPTTTQVNEDDWNFELADCCTPGSLGCEAATCPCILAGRTHGRIHDVPPDQLTSTNGYCCGWCSLFSFCLCCVGCYWIMGSATRREIRYRYGIKGTNCEDCWKSAFCCYCALVQEEKEVLLREERKKNARVKDEGYTRRTQEMSYAGTS